MPGRVRVSLANAVGAAVWDTGSVALAAAAAAAPAAVASPMASVAAPMSVVVVVVVVVGAAGEEEAAAPSLLRGAPSARMGRAGGQWVGGGSLLGAG